MSYIDNMATPPTEVEAERTHATDSQIADAMGVYKGNVSRIVNGVRRPTDDFITRAERGIGWTRRAQYIALADNKYPERFRAYIEQWTPPAS